MNSSTYGKADESGMKLPQHIAIIMDGNGRWAEQHKVARAKGHEQGGATVQRVIDLCIEKGIPWLTLYAFSTENWGRSKIEVNYLMKMLEKFLKQRLPEMMEKNVRLHAIGELDMLPPKCRRQLDASIEQTAANTALNVVLALSYGSRQEITAAAQKLARKVQQGELQPDDITPEMLGDHLYTAGMPDPDLMIRTSGEMRISNYLLWQLSYAELWITDVLWPDFGREELDAALAEYAGRNRRYGKR
ncbi:MAG: isoprenyl transferase [Akkermansia sp.]|nr:isoprenyl transferase [Akkermansia sp.]